MEVFVFEVFILSIHLFPVSVGLVWGSDKADPELASEVTKTIGTTILFPDVSTSTQRDVSK